MNDAVLAPKPFDGLNSTADAAEKWLKYFQTFAKLRGLFPNAQLDMFSLLMTEDAADWLNSLPPADIATLPQIIEQFKKRFLPTELDRWNKASSLWSRQQKADEPVDKYIADIRNAVRNIAITEEMLRFAFIRGLQPEIRRYVLQSKPKTIEEAIQEAHSGKPPSPHHNPLPPRHPSTNKCWKP